MTGAQRTKEIRMMIGWLEQRELMDYAVSQSSPKRWSVHLVGGMKHVGDSKTTHAYLSGITDLMHHQEYLEDNQQRSTKG